MDENTVKFKYIFDDAYNPKYVNGAFGGITPNGEVVVNFYFERAGLPIEQEFKLQEDGSIGELCASEPEEFKFVRYVQGGITMSQTDARGVAEWLLGMLNEGKEDEA